MNIEKTDNKIRQGVIDLLTEDMGIEVPEPDTNLLEEGYMDSLLFVKMLSLLEETFDIHISVEELDFEHFKTVVGITAFVEQKLEFKDPVDGYASEQRV